MVFMASVSQGYATKQTNVEPVCSLLRLLVHK